MQTIQGLLLGICFAGVLGGVVRLLAPGGSTERVLRLAATLFLLAAAVVPLRALRTAISVPAANMPSNAAAEAVLRNAETAIEQAAREVLRRHGCADAEVFVTAENEHGEVHADAFVITGVPPEKAQEIADEIFDSTGEMPRMETEAASAGGG